MLEVFSGSPEDTQRLGRELAKVAHAGDVFFLDGELGSGKTELTKGFVAQLAPDALVSSPTYAIENVYVGPDTEVHHFDLYRIDDELALEDVGIMDVCGEDMGITLIEWGEPFKDVLAQAYVEVGFSRDEVAGDTERTVRVRGVGEREKLLVEKVRMALEEAKA